MLSCSAASWSAGCCSGAVPALQGEEGWANGWVGKGRGIRSGEVMAGDWEGLQAPCCPHSGSGLRAMPETNEEQPLPNPTCGQLCAVLQLASCAGSQLLCRPKGAGEQAGLLLAMQGGVRQAGGFCSLTCLGGSSCWRVRGVRQAAGCEDSRSVPR